MEEDLGNYLPSWQDGKGLRGDNVDQDSTPLAPAVGPPSDPCVLEPEDADDSGFAGPAGPAGIAGPPGPAPTFTTGVATSVSSGAPPSITVTATGAANNYKIDIDVPVGPGPIMVTGVATAVSSGAAPAVFVVPTGFNTYKINLNIPAGMPGVSGAPGTPGAASTVPGPPGPTGPTGPKTSIIRTDRGNITFTCAEGAEPWIFDILRMPTNHWVRLRPDFYASTASGSLFVQAVVPDNACTWEAHIGGDMVRVVCAAETTCTVTVYGRHLHFPGPEWVMPHQTDQARQRSWDFWNGEWKPTEITGYL